MRINVNAANWLTVLAVAACVGCGGAPAPTSDLEAAAAAMEQGATDAAAKAQADLAAQAAALEQQAIDAKAKAEADALAAQKAAAAKLASEGPTELTIDDFQRGDKIKGGDYLAVTVRGGIRAEQKIKLATVTHALALYNATEGRGPKSHEEFMEKVVKFNQIELEPLQEPYEYWFNAEEQLLMKRVKPEVLSAAKAEAGDALPAAEAPAAETPAAEAPATEATAITPDP
ncbi:MAG: hypothetical protein ACRCT8_14440 [Lacipirellulaceae bacterium]